MDIKQWLIDKTAEETGRPASTISCDESFYNVGLDSLSLLSLSFDLEAYIGEDLDPTVFIEYNTINKLSEWYNSRQ